jgi:predicted MFS family arabinose efflux permease
LLGEEAGTQLCPPLFLEAAAGPALGRHTSEMAALIASGRPWRSVGLIAYAFAVTMLGTTLPTSLYPAYQRHFMFGQVTETVVFAIYAIGVLVTLLLLGQVSDRIGRRPVLFVAVLAAVLSSAVFVIANAMTGGSGLLLLLVGRLLSGASAGLTTGTATAFLADTVPPGKGQVAGLVAAMSQVIGLGLGPLVGGLLLTRIPHPLTTIYVVYAGLLAIAALALAVVPETVDRSRSTGPLVTPIPLMAVARQATTTGLIGFAGFAVLGLFTGVAAAFLALAGYTDPLVTGLVVFSVFIASAIGQLASARLPGRTSLLAGTAGLAAGAAIVGVSLHMRSVGLLEAGGLIAGVGVGMSFRAALGEVTASSPPSQRGEAASSFFIICYLGISVPIVGLGIASGAYGLVSAGPVFAALVAAVGVTTLILIARRRPA